MKFYRTTELASGRLELVVGLRTLGYPASDEAAVHLFDTGKRRHTFPVAELTRPSLGKLAPFRERIQNVIVGYCDQPDLDFLRELPEVLDVWVMSPSVKDLSGLTTLPRLQKLAIDRPTCRMDALGSLSTLTRLYIDAWRPGADSIFELTHLDNLGIQKYPYPNLGLMSRYAALRELWINCGRMETLDGAPTSLRILRVSDCRRLTSLVGLRACPALEKLLVDGCRSVGSLDGIESCQNLRTLSIVKSGEISSLEPLRELTQLDYVVVADGAWVKPGEVDALYALRKLSMLIITRSSGVDPDRMRAASPGCEVRLTSR